MSGSMLGEDPQATARALQAALEAMTAQLAQVKTSLRRGKRVVAALVISLLVDVAVTIGVGIAVHQANDASARANATIAQLHSTQVSACRAGNQTRAKEVMLWTHIFDLSVGSGRPVTAAQRKADEQLLAYIRRTFQAKNCSAVYKLHAAAQGK